MNTDKENKKINKTVVEFEYEGKPYKLEYTAASLKTLEDRGFDASLMESRTIQYPEEIFCGAFIANHDDVPYNKRMEIFKEFANTAEDGGDADDIISVFTVMVAEAVAEIRSHRGNVKWRVTR